MDTHLPKRRLFRSELTTADWQEVVESVFAAAAQRQGRYVCFANVHMLMEAEDDPSFQEILNQAWLALPDGAPVAMYLGRKYKIAQKRMAGMDMLPHLLQEAEKRGVSVLFYGSTPQVLAAIEARIVAELPALRIAGLISPPFRQMTEAEEAVYTTQINESGAGLVFVALGCPKQEKWMARHQAKIGACMLGVGQAFLTYARLEKRLPPALRDLPIEWIFRLAQEPRRLFKRYAITNTRFVWKVLRGE